MYCRKCGAPQADGAASCHACNTRVGEGHNFCPECGQETDPSASFCGVCGAKVEPAATKGKVGADYREPDRPAARASTSDETSGGSAASRLRGGSGASTPKAGSAAERLRSGGSGATVRSGSAAERLRGGGSAASRLRGGSGSSSSSSSGGRTSSGSSYTYSTPSSGSASLNGKSKVTVILLCLFLGGLGVHNFYMGETKRGAMKLIGTFLLYGIGSILALIDLVKLIIGSYRYNPDKWF